MHQNIKKHTRRDRWLPHTDSHKKHTARRKIVEFLYAQLKCDNIHMGCCGGCVCCVCCVLCCIGVCESYVRIYSVTVRRVLLAVCVDFRLTSAEKANQTDRDAVPDATPNRGIASRHIRRSTTTTTTTRCARCSDLGLANGSMMTTMMMMVVVDKTRFVWCHI